jgi:hypothetical protein
MSAYKKGCETYLRKRGAVITYPKDLHNADALMIAYRAGYAAMGDRRWPLLNGDWFVISGREAVTLEFPAAADTGTEP